MKKAKKIIYTLLGLLLASVIGLVGVILYAEYSGRRFLPEETGGVSEVAFPDDESRLVYDENGNIAELPGMTADAGAENSGEDTQENGQEVKEHGTSTKAPAEAPAAEDGAEEGETEKEADGAAYTFIMNKESSIFHYDTCPDVQNISEENRLSMTGTRDEVIGRGYEPCGNCNP